MASVLTVPADLVAYLSSQAAAAQAALDAARRRGTWNAERIAMQVERVNKWERWATAIGKLDAAVRRTSPCPGPRPQLKGGLAGAREEVA